MLSQEAGSVVICSGSLASLPVFSSGKPNQTGIITTLISSFLSLLFSPAVKLLLSLSVLN